MLDEVSTGCAVRVGGETPNQIHVTYQPLAKTLGKNQQGSFYLPAD